MSTRGRVGTDRRRHSFRRSIAFVVPLLLPGVAAPARAEVHIVGTIEDVRVTTDKDSISDVLAALGATFNVRLRNAAGLDAAAAPTYSGSLGQVIARLLERHDYVIRHERDAFEVIIIGNKGESAVPARTAPAAPDKSFISPWK